MTTAPVAEPLRLSPSRVALYSQCPLRYRFRYLNKLPDPNSLTPMRGTLVHAVLERLFDYPAGQRTRDVAQSLVIPEWQRILEETTERDGEITTSWTAEDDPDWPKNVLTRLADFDATDEERLIDKARLMIDRWFWLEEPSRLTPAARELEVEVPLADGVTLHGIIDRVETHPEAGERITDYKSGCSPDEKYQRKPLEQMRLYGLMRWRTEGRIPAMLQLLYLADGAIIRHTPDAADLEAIERKATAVAEQITHSTETGEWPAKTSKLCDWCPYAPICPTQRPVGAP